MVQSHESPVLEQHWLWALVFPHIWALFIKWFYVWNKKYICSGADPGKTNWIHWAIIGTFLWRHLGKANWLVKSTCRSTRMGNVLDPCCAVVDLFWTHHQKNMVILETSTLSNMVESLNSSLNWTLWVFSFVFFFEPSIMFMVVMIHHNTISHKTHKQMMASLFLLRSRRSTVILLWWRVEPQSSH